MPAIPARHVLLPLLALSLSGCAARSLEAGPIQDAEPPADAGSHAFFQNATLDESVPTPESVIGHKVGAAAVRYERMVEYMRALADASDLVTLTPHASTHEGRTLFHLTITSEANHARLQEILADNTKLADPRLLASDAEADRLIDSAPGIAWMAYCIHGDELSGTDAALLLAYRLAAGTDELATRMRDELVIHIDPLQNPDGRERYLAQLQTLMGKVENPDYAAMQHSGLWSAGRGNHYLFDLNRDWLMQVHPETHGRTAAIQKWNPQLVVDGHEMGSLDTYLFDPPREPINRNLAGAIMDWRYKFSADQAAAFDERGWSYYTQDWYEEWYPGYTNAWAGLNGAIGILYEQAGVNAASVRQATGQDLTYRQAVHHQYVSSIANLKSLLDNRPAILRDFYGVHKQAISNEGPFNDTLLIVPGPDRARLGRFANVLDRHGIEYTVARADFEAGEVVSTFGETAETKSFPAGTIIVRSSQPHRQLLHAILGFDPHMTDQFLKEERTELEKRRGSRLYDVTAWNLPMAYNLDASWAGSVPPDAGGAGVAGGAVLDMQKHAAPPDESGYGYIMVGDSSDAPAAIVRMFDQSCMVRVATKPFALAGRTYPRGTVLLRRHENPDNLGAIVRDIAAALAVEIIPTGTALSENGWDLGGPKFQLLQQPRVAIASQWPISTTSFGSVWFGLDARLALRCSPINVQSLGGIDMRRYNVLVLPGSFGLGAVLSDRAQETIRSWVEEGGTLIAMSGSAAFLANEDRGLSGVRLRRDSLDELDVYEEAVARERGSHEVSVNVDRIWDLPGDDNDNADADPAADNGDDGDDDDNASSNHDQKKSPTDLKARKRLDEWQRIFSSRGAMASATADTEHWLCFGVAERIPVLFSGSQSYLSRHPVRTPVRLAPADELRLSGLLWPEARQRMANSAYATVESVGRGQVILFASDPFFRGYTEETGRLLFNAVVLGPGMGARAPIPW